MRIYPKKRYVIGTRKKACEICGWDHLLSEMVINHEGLVVGKDCYEKLQPNPQDKTTHVYKPNIYLGE